MGLVISSTVINQVKKFKHIHTNIFNLTPMDFKNEINMNILQSHPHYYSNKILNLELVLNHSKHKPTFFNTIFSRLFLSFFT